MTLLRALLIGEFDERAILDELRRRGFDPETERASDPDELGDALGGGWDIALCESNGSGPGALETLRILQERNLDLPVIVFADDPSDGEALAALRSGAADLVGPRDLSRLGAAVERELRAAASRRERARLEDRFRHSQKMEALGRLAGGVAHDFNNLLTIITGYGDLLATDGGLTPDQSDALGQMRQAAARAAELTRRLLAFGRREPAQPRVFHTNELLLGLEGMLRRLIGEDVELTVSAAASSDAVEADPGGLEQVIMNLAVNARDAMPAGGRLTIESLTVQIGEGLAAMHLGIHAGPHVAISVTDTGSGMDEETLSHAFEPFFTTKPEGRGTGLGLATAYSVVRQSRGAIGILSEPGKGSTVWVYLPVAEEKAAKPGKGPLLP